MCLISSPCNTEYWASLPWHQAHAWLLGQPLLYQQPSFVWEYWTPMLKHILETPIAQNLAMLSNRRWSCKEQNYKQRNLEVEMISFTPLLFYDWRSGKLSTTAYSTSDMQAWCSSYIALTILTKVTNNYSTVVVCMTLVPSQYLIDEVSHHLQCACCSQSAVRYSGPTAMGKGMYSYPKLHETAEQMPPLNNVHTWYSFSVCIVLHKWFFE